MGFLGLFKSNFTRIAENTTKYYLELKNNYSDMFPDEASLLAGAGILDAHIYVLVEHSIELETILDIAKLALSTEQVPSKLSSYRRLVMEETLGKFHKGNYKDALLEFFEEKDEPEKEPLFDFIFSLEVELFVVDSPRFSRSEIALACYKKANTITKAIQDTKGKYVGEARFASEVAAFMESSEFEPIRKQLGVKL